MDGGGAQKSVLGSARYFEKYYEVHLMFGRGGILEPQARKNINNFYSLKTLRHDVCMKNLFWDALAFLQMARLIFKIKPAIVHTNCPKAGILGRWAAFFSLRRPKIVHTYHGLGFSVYNGKFKYKLFALIERVSALISDKLVFVSLANMGEAHGLGIGNYKKNILIRAGIPAPRLSKKPPFKKTSQKVVLGIGNAKPLKNAAAFIKIAKKVKEKNDNFTFLYAGMEGGNPYVKFLGFRRDIEGLLCAADIYLSTSLSEGLAMSALEAAQLGVPIFSYDAPGMSEAVTNGLNGQIFKIGDDEALTSAILNFKKEDYKKSFDKTEFSAASTVKNQKKLYENLLTKKRALK